jgi:hypothetical protein
MTSAECQLWVKKRRLDRVARMLGYFAGAVVYVVQFRLLLIDVQSNHPPQKLLLGLEVRRICRPRQRFRGNVINGQPKIV